MKKKKKTVLDFRLYSKTFATWKHKGQLKLIIIILYIYIYK